MRLLIWAAQALAIFVIVMVVVSVVDRVVGPPTDTSAQYAVLQAQAEADAEEFRWRQEAERTTQTVAQARAELWVGVVDELGEVVPHITMFLIAVGLLLAVVRKQGG